MIKFADDTTVVGRGLDPPTPKPLSDRTAEPQLPKCAEGNQLEDGAVGDLLPLWSGEPP